MTPRQPSGERAARQAIGQFGTVAELAPHFQRELTIAQARHTAGAIAVLVPFLFACWHSAELADGSADGRLPELVQLTAAHLGGVAATTAPDSRRAVASRGSRAKLDRTPPARRSRFQSVGRGLEPHANGLGLVFLCWAQARTPASRAWTTRPRGAGGADLS